MFKVVAKPLQKHAAYRARPRPAPPSLHTAPLAQVLWSLTFAFSCNLLLLVVFEVIGVIDPG